LPTYLPTASGVFGTRADAGAPSRQFDGKKVKVLYGAGWKPWVPVEKVDWNGPVGSAIDTQDKPKSAAAAARAAADMAKENAKESGGK
jgi:hypothetical protein